MRIDAVYENGIIKPVTPLKLKEEKIRMQVIIPDNLLDASLEQGQKSKMRSKIDAILGEYAAPYPVVTSAEDKDAWDKHLEEKYDS